MSSWPGSIGSNQLHIEGESLAKKYCTTTDSTKLLQQRPQQHQEQPMALPAAPFLPFLFLPPLMPPLALITCRTTRGIHSQIAVAFLLKEHPSISSLVRAVYPHLLLFYASATACSQSSSTLNTTHLLLHVWVSPLNFLKMGVEITSRSSKKLSRERGQNMRRLSLNLKEDLMMASLPLSLVVFGSEHLQITRFTRRKASTATCHRTCRLLSPSWALTIILRSARRCSDRATYPTSLPLRHHLKTTARAATLMPQSHQLS